MSGTEVLDITTQLYQLQDQTGRNAHAYAVVFQTLEWLKLPEVRQALGLSDEHFHLTGQQLCEYMYKYSVNAYGLLAHAVWEYLGITCSEDIGDLIYDLLEVGLIGAQPTDKKEDFDDAFQINGERATIQQKFDAVTIKIEYDHDSAEWRTIYNTAKEHW